MKTVAGHTLFISGVVLFVLGAFIGLCGIVGVIGSLYEAIKERYPSTWALAALLYALIGWCAMKLGVRWTR